MTTTTRTRKATIKDLIATEAAKSFDAWEETASPATLTDEGTKSLSQTPVFLFIAAAVAILIVGKAFMACAVLAFNLGRKVVDAAIDARTPKIDFGVYRPIFES